MIYFVQGNIIGLNAPILISFICVITNLIPYIGEENVPSESEWGSHKDPYIKKFPIEYTSSQVAARPTISENSNLFYVDESILTLNTPDFEQSYFNIKDTSNIRLVGIGYKTDSFANYTV